MAYYYEGRDGASFTEAVVHYREDCDELGEPVRPIAEETIEASEGIETCPECAPLDSESESDSAPETEHSIPFPTDEQAINAGVCPWCDDYEGDHVGRHASSAHPEAWAKYQDD